MSTPDPTESLLSDVLTGYRDEYKELADIWKQLDSKAQGTITISGVFLAGVFAFARDLTDPTELWQKRLLTIATIFLVVSILSALRAIYVREVDIPPFGDGQNDLALDLIRNADVTDAETRRSYLRDQIRMWSVANGDVGALNDQKAWWTVRAQLILVAAIVCAAIATGLAIW